MNIVSKDISIENKELVSFMKKQTPAFYADFCAKTRLKTNDKRKLTNIWLNVTKYTIKDLDFARNRHPYWKKIKEKGSVERNRIRREKYDFYTGKDENKGKKWTEAELKEFLSMNENNKDWEIAKHFKRGIPAIQYLRRKIQMAIKVAAKKKISKVDNSFLFKMLMLDERVLKRIIAGTEKVIAIVNGKVITKETESANKKAAPRKKTAAGKKR